jgi:hypothetical protein
MAPSIELTSACRKSKGSTISVTTPMASAITDDRASPVGRGASGIRFSVSSPRAGTRAPRQNMAIATSTKNSSSASPLIGLPLSVGNQLCEAK